MQRKTKQKRIRQRMEIANFQIKIPLTLRRNLEYFWYIKIFVYSMIYLGILKGVLLKPVWKTLL